MRLIRALVLFLIAVLCLEAPASAADSAIELPSHARLNVRGDGWVCDYGYRRAGAGCIEIAVPRNATLGPYGDTWICQPGYYTYRDVCLQDEGAEGYETPRKSFKPWQIVAQLSAKPTSTSKRSDGERAFYRFAPFLAAAVALGVWSFFFRGRDATPQPTRNYSSTAITVQRPRRAVTQRTPWNAWPRCRRARTAVSRTITWRARRRSCWPPFRRAAWPTFTRRCPRRSWPTTRPVADARRSAAT